MAHQDSQADQGPCEGPENQRNVVIKLWPVFSSDVLAPLTQSSADLGIWGLASLCEGPSCSGEVRVSVQTVPSIYLGPSQKSACVPRVIEGDHMYGHLSHSP